MQGMPDTPDGLTKPNLAPNPVARLAASRAALAHQIAQAREPLGTQSRHALSSEVRPDLNGMRAAQDLNQSNGRGLWQFTNQAIASWWQNHPLRLATDVTRPYLSEYASHKPFELIGLAAGLGALAVFIKPWRLVSLTGLAALAFKSTDLTATVLSFMTRSASSPKPTSTQPTPKASQ